MNPKIETYRGVTIKIESDMVTSKHVAHFTFPLESNAPDFQVQVRTALRSSPPGEQRSITSNEAAEVLAGAKREIDAFFDNSPFN